MNIQAVSCRPCWRFKNCFTFSIKLYLTILLRLGIGQVLSSVNKGLERMYLKRVSAKKTSCDWDCIVFSNDSKIVILGSKLT